MLIFKPSTLIFFCILSIYMPYHVEGFSFKRNFGINTYRNGEYLQTLPNQAFISYDLQDLGTSPSENSGTRTFGMRKKYDRNCFFSPVQCMISFGNTQPEAQIGWGKK
uniref:Uncharacterized protein n=1 Tax=Parastrongyloides trichosuri TaxID=131310 RepID=A0A0N4ZCI7_PARTI